jgi:copper chaperone CopZ
MSPKSNKNKHMKVLILFVILLSCNMANAQLGKKLKDKAKEVVERKANQKADEAINKGVEKIDSVITGKKRDGKSGKQKTGTGQSVTSGNSNGSPDESAISIDKEVTIKTNIRCEAGKDKIETILRNTDGVSSAIIDYDTGKLYLSSETSDIPNKVIELIRQNGFEADGKKPTKSLPNPCK